MTQATQTQQALLEALAFQLELGADEAIGEAPRDRFEETPPRRGADPAAPPAVPARPPAEAWQSALALARAAATLDELAEAMRRFEGSELRLGARNLVFADGLPGARVMVIGEAPGGEEDRTGKPFVGRAGQLLDRMLAAIGLARTAPAPEDAVYITNILPWRPPGNRTPSEAEVLSFLPFVLRHVELAGPDFILALGGTSAKALLGTATGIKRLRGRWVRHEASALPLLPSFHPAYLLRAPADKRLAWRDLLSLRAALDGEAPDV
ncbi:MAG TPA: uracil-DNA glycosylase [Thermohalobaculum sp.]|nr:uracil-DNA glycosylase [Thermohalobaculum sp.]